MNEFEAWSKLLSEWHEVNRMKQLNQELYDLLGGGLMYCISYAKKHSIPIPDMESMVKRVNELIDEVNATNQTATTKENTNSMQHNHNCGAAPSEGGHLGLFTYGW